MSNLTSQKDAVFSAVVSVFNSFNVNFNSGVDNAHSLLNPAMRMEVNAILVNGLMNGTVSFGKTGLSRNEVKTYASGLLSNWLKKDSRLSGGAPSKKISSTANSSNARRSTDSRISKAVSNDTQIKALKSLLKIKTDPNEIAEIEGFINKRVSEISGVAANV